eukprot:Lankesteria_metandrocarpae@DN10526_c0_g1_i1.p2
MTNIFDNNLELCKAYGFVLLAFDGLQVYSRTAAYEEHVRDGAEWLCSWVVKSVEVYSDVVEEAWRLLVYDTLLRRTILKRLCKSLGWQTLLEGVEDCRDDCDELPCDVILCIFAELAHCMLAFSDAHQQQQRHQQHQQQQHQQQHQHDTIKTITERDEVNSSASR